MNAVDNVRDELIHQITDAFEDVERGDGISLHEAAAIDGYRMAEECAAARQQDTERSWQDVPAQDIEDNYPVLTYLDAEGFRYYLPAFMVWSLKNYQTSASVSVDAPIYELDLSGNEDRRERKMEQFRLFSDEQRVAACRFLRFMSEQVDADASMARPALDNYWGQFCGDEE